MTSPASFKSIQYVVDQQGRPAAVQISIADWESLLNWVEDLEDRALVREVLPRLRKGPAAAGSLQWEDIRAEWDAPEPRAESDAT